MESIYNFSNEEKEKIAYLKKLFTQDFIKWDKKQFKITKNKITPIITNVFFFKLTSLLFNFLFSFVNS